MLNILKIPDGIEGIKKTLERMVKMAREAIRDERFVRFSRQIASLVGKPNDKMAEASAIFSWAQQNLHYVKDPLGIELITKPGTLLQTGAGDCDDLSIFFAAMFESIGIPARFVAIQTRPDSGYNHVYPEALIDNQWIPFDLASANPKIGTAAQRFGEPMIYDISVKSVANSTLNATEPPKKTNIGLLVLGGLGLAAILFGSRQ